MNWSSTVSRSSLLLGFTLTLMACGADADADAQDGLGPSEDVGEDAGGEEQGDAGDDSTSPPDATAFTHKMIKGTGENMFASLAYECPQCTFEQWLAIDPPEGWSKGPAQVLAASGGEMRSRPTLDGVPDAVDFIEEVPGDEYQIIAKTLDGAVVERINGGAIVEAQVMRDTLLRFDAGRRVHELTDPEGRVFVLFAYEVDPSDVVIPDFEDPNFMGDFTAPTGWTYASRVLEEALTLDTPDVATVLAIRGEVVSTWELR